MLSDKLIGQIKHCTNERTFLYVIIVKPATLRELMLFGVCQNLSLKVMWLQKKNNTIPNFQNTINFWAHFQANFETPYYCMFRHAISQ